MKQKLFNSKAAALQNGCGEDQITEKDGVFYCNCSIQKKENKDIKDLSKEDKALEGRSTKEYKVKRKTK